VGGTLRQAREGDPASSEKADDVGEGPLRCGREVLGYHSQGRPERTPVHEGKVDGGASPVRQGQLRTVVCRSGSDVEDDGDDEVGCGEWRFPQNTRDPDRENEASAHVRLR